MGSPSLFIRTLKYLMSRVASVEVRGAEHLNQSTGQIIVANHVGWADPLWMGYAVYPCCLRQMAKRELFRNPLMRWFVSTGGGFPVDRGHTSPATIKQTIAILDEGGTVLIFPEGTRSGGEGNVKRGAATIALYAKVDVVPAHYEGPRAIELKHCFCRPRIGITFGAPIVVPHLVSVDKAAAIALTHQIDAALKALQDVSAQSFGSPMATHDELAPVGNRQN